MGGSSAWDRGAVPGAANGRLSWTTRCPFRLFPSSSLSTQSVLLPMEYRDRPVIPWVGAPRRRPPTRPLQTSGTPPGYDPDRRPERPPTRPLQTTRTTSDPTPYLPPERPLAAPHHPQRVD